MPSFLRILIDVLIYITIGAVMASLFYHLKRKDLFGGYIGGLVVGFIGAIIGGLSLSPVFKFILYYLSKDNSVNILSGLVGAFVFLYIMNRLNHNRERKKY